MNQTSLMVLLREIRTEGARVYRTLQKVQRDHRWFYRMSKREPVRRSVIAMKRCILYAWSQINFNNPELNGFLLFSGFAVYSLSPFIFIILMIYNLQFCFISHSNFRVFDAIKTKHILFLLHEEKFIQIKIKWLIMKLQSKVNKT